MSTWKNGSLLSFSLLALSQPALAASYTYTIINPPGVNYATTAGINDAGQVTGTYIDPVQDKSVSYIYTGGKFQIIPAPGNASFSTAPVKIGPSGTVIGLYGKKQFREPFIFSPGDKKASRFPGFPKGAIGFPGDINAAGELVGQIVVQKVAHGFVDIGGITTFLDVPGGQATSASFVNGSGRIAGGYRDGKNFQGFVYDNGSFDLVKVPKAIETDITYLVDDSSFGGWSTVKYVNKGDPSVIGFTDIAGVIATYRYPGAAETYLAGALSAQENFGTFNLNPGQGGYHYLNGQYYNLNLPGQGSAFMSGVNSSGAFAGYVYGSPYYSTAFIATCAAGPGQCTD